MVVCGWGGPGDPLERIRVNLLIDESILFPDHADGDMSI